MSNPQKHNKRTQLAKATKSVAFAGPTTLRGPLVRALCSQGQIVIFDKYFLVVPVYRIPEDKYSSKMKDDFERLISTSWEESFQKSNPDLVEKWRGIHRSSYGGDWEFNEIVGYIKLFFMGSQVRGEYWSTKPRRKVRTRKKQFEFKALKLAAESEIWDRTNEGILAAIEEYLSRCKTELKGRHIDLREFEALKDHINWLSLHKTVNVFA